MTYIPLHAHSFHSLLDGLSSPKDMIDRCIELGLPGIALTDHGTISGMKAFFNAAKKKKIKPICGIEAYVCEQDPLIKDTSNNKRHHLIILAKNDDGIEDLMQLVSETNRPDYFYRKPRIDLNGIKPFASRGNLIALSACIAGELPSSLFTDFKHAVNIGGHGENLSEIRRELRNDWKEKGKEIILKYQDVFGKNNYFLELQDEGMSSQTITVECLRTLGKELDVPTVATIDSHYCRKEQAEDQRVLLCSQLHTTMADQQRKLEAGADIMDFFVSDNYYIPSYEEMAEKFTAAELETTLAISESIKYKKDLNRAPNIPVFVSGDKKGTTSDDYLKTLCVAGAKKKLGHLTDDSKKTYWDRLNKELSVVRDAGLADYFLIVWDICKYVDSLQAARGVGRGSGAGSLINYLLNITGIDPIQYDLYFERFYNVSRNIKPHFNVSDQMSYLKWLADSHENIRGQDYKIARKQVSEFMAQRIKNGVAFTEKMKAETEWVDQNNPSMWFYIRDRLQQQAVGVNIDNSHLAFGLGIVDQVKNENVVTNPGHISLPDIDLDVSVEIRDTVIAYLIDKWGSDYVSQMISFGRLQGKAALKEVFRIQSDTVKQLMKVKSLKEGKNPDDISTTAFDLCNTITAEIPDEAAISDELEVMREDDNEYGILRWACDNVDTVRKAYEWYKPLFDQAMRIEGTKKSQSRHPAGVVISKQPIKDLFPLVHDSSHKNRVIGVEMADAEAMGGVKFDVLGVVALDKIWHAMSLINSKG